MLIVTRRIRQSVVVENLDGAQRELEVTVLQLGGGKVRLGFDLRAAGEAEAGDKRERRPSYRVLLALQAE